MAKLFDTHAHYTDKRLRKQPELLDEIFASDVSHIVTVSTNLTDAPKCAELAKKYENLYATAGIHPHDTGHSGKLDDAMNILSEQLQAEKVVALGEIGLDYHYNHSEPEVQMQFFRAQMELAAEKNLPVIIHDREAHGDTMDMLREFKNRVTGVLHCYSGSAEQVKEYVKMGWYISFSGVITYENAVKSHEAILATPSDKLLVETDCPYLSPVPMRKKCNHSGYLHYTAEKAAEILQMDYEAFCDLEIQNAKRLFCI